LGGGGKRPIAVLETAQFETSVLHCGLNGRRALIDLSGIQPIAPRIFMSDLLNTQEVKESLKRVPEWDHEKKHIERTFEFDEFSEAIDFVNSVAEIAEEDDHHPDLDIRFNKVRVVLSTRSEGGVTALDFDLAEKIDTLVEG
jgi:4a-hydroxytetrahydrobiopterin dehydratase